jgi:DNA-binding MarR family transcriptional regulator/N-acetylglutamate synthase-like GNAT family acetyltransferase
VALTKVVRAFNRFYTEHMGLLSPRLPGSELSLSEGRLLYEIVHNPGVTAAELSRRLGLDRAQLSRTISRFLDRGWLVRSATAAHGKRLELRASDEGLALFAKMDSGTQADVARRLAHLSEADRTQLTSALQEAQRLLSRSGQPPGFQFRGLQTGDVGTVIAQQARGYGREFGWDIHYEALIAGILADFVRNFDPATDDAWIVERAGEIAGSVFLVRDEAPATGRLRLLYVEPWARGENLGMQLVQRCVDRARQLGYGELVLWTNDVLAAARQLYERAGFVLVAQEPHHSFGKHLVGQTWSLKL